MEVEAISDFVDFVDIVDEDDVRAFETDGSDPGSDAGFVGIGLGDIQSERTDAIAVGAGGPIGAILLALFLFETVYGRDM